MGLSLMQERAQKRILNWLEKAGYKELTITPSEASFYSKSVSNGKESYHLNASVGRRFDVSIKNVERNKTYKAYFFVASSQTNCGLVLLEYINSIAHFIESHLKYDSAAYKHFSANVLAYIMLFIKDRYDKNLIFVHTQENNITSQILEYLPGTSMITNKNRCSGNKQYHKTIDAHEIEDLINAK